MLKITARASSFPVTLDQLKDHVEAPADHDDDKLLRALKAAIEYCEEHTSLSLALKTFEYRADTWPCGPAEIRLPKAPVVDVLSVKYLDEDGVLRTVSSSDWTWERTFDGATVTFGADFTAPDLQESRRGAVRVEFEAGFDDPALSGSGDDPDLHLPERAVQAVLMLAAHWYANREAADFDETHVTVMAANALLNQLWIPR